MPVFFQLRLQAIGIRLVGIRLRGERIDLGLERFHLVKRLFMLCGKRLRIRLGGGEFRGERVHLRGEFFHLRGERSDLLIQRLVLVGGFAFPRVKYAPKKLMAATSSTASTPMAIFGFAFMMIPLSLSISIHFLLL